MAAFALVAVLGALPVGLQAVREAQSQEIAANVARRMQANLQRIAFATDGSGTTVQNLAASTRFFTEVGIETGDPATAARSVNPAFYKAVFTVEDAFFDDGLSAANRTLAAQASNARNVTMTLYYPQMGNIQGRRKFVYSFLIARQGLE